MCFDQRKLKNRFFSEFELPKYKKVRNAGRELKTRKKFLNSVYFIFCD